MRRILSLSGGGYLGLFSLSLLEQIEADEGPLGKHFDLIAGTSVGGLIALALASGRSAAEICKVMVKNGTKIFPVEQDTAARLFVAGHRTEPLAAVVDSLLGDAELGDLEIRVVVPTVCITTARTTVFRTPHLPCATLTRKTKLRDVALATAAAPSYYVPHRIGSNDYADGGLVANSPDAIAVADAFAMGWRRDEIRLLSVGTSFSSPAEPAGTRKNWSLSGWLRRSRLINLAMAGQMDLARQIARTLLSEQAVITVDPQQSGAQAKELALDRATPVSTNTLKSLAQEEFAKLLQRHRLEVEAINRHEPEEAYFFD
jgi:predicted acylesterase/phospholipase RssA